MAPIVDTNPPVVTSARTLSATQIQVTFDQAVTVNGSAITTGFTVSRTTASSPPATTTLSITGISQSNNNDDSITINLANEIGPSDTITLSYVHSASAVLDDNNNVLLGFTNLSVENNDISSIGFTIDSATYEPVILGESGTRRVATHTNLNPPGSGSGVSITDLAFNNNGSRVFTLNRATSAGAGIYTYDLDTPYDLSTATQVGGVYNPSLGNNLFAMAFSTDGLKLFIVPSEVAFNIIEFTLTRPFDLSSGVSDDSSIRR